MSSFISNKFCKSNQNFFLSPTEPFNEKLMGKQNDELYNTEEHCKLHSTGKLRSTTGSTSSIALPRMRRLFFTFD